MSTGAQTRPDCRAGSVEVVAAPPLDQAAHTQRATAPCPWHANNAQCINDSRGHRAQDVNPPGEIKFMRTVYAMSKAMVWNPDLAQCQLTRLQGNAFQHSDPTKPLKTCVGLSLGESPAHAHCDGPVAAEELDAAQICLSITTRLARLKPMVAQAHGSKLVREIR